MPWENSEKEDYVSFINADFEISVVFTIAHNIYKCSKSPKLLVDFHISPLIQSNFLS